MQLISTKNDSEILASNFQGEAHNFIIGDAGMIIGIIRNKIYSYPIRTSVGEYLSNARDACVEAGTDPSEIEVHLPTTFEPFFSIRDYGTGMSEQRVKEVFVAYGVSTKREDKNQLGCFGIGAKSGFSISDSFVVESFHEGMRREYIADIGERKEGRLLKFNESPTTERNGVLIKIPAREWDFVEFKKAAARATWLWEKRPKFNEDIIYPKLKYKSENFSLWETDGGISSGIYVDAGGIPFISDSRENAFYSSRGITVINVDPTKIGIAASREGFSNTEYVRKRIELCEEELKKAIIDSLNTSDASGYVEILRQFKGVYGLHKLTAEWFLPREYSIRLDGHRGNDCLTLKKGILWKIESGISYAKSKQDQVDIGTDVYISDYSGPLDIFKEIPLKTRKALAGLKRDYGVSWVLFKGELSDQGYQDLCNILGTKGNIEDIKFEKPERVYRAKEVDGVEKEKGKIYVYPFRRAERGAGYVPGGAVLLEDCAKATHIFYGEGCVTNYRELASYLPDKYRVEFVRAGKKAQKELEKNPNAFPMDRFQQFILSNEDILQHFSEVRGIDEVENPDTFMRDRASKFISKKVNMQLIRDFCKKCEDKRYLSLPGFVSNVIKPYSFKKEASEIKKFYKLYPLLECVDRYRTTKIPDEVFNGYISSVDKGTQDGIEF